MWFKRRKSAEQDHALSESLKSLQSLLSETGRREPNLDPADSPADEPDVNAHPAPDPRDAPALKPRSSRRPANTGDDTRSGEPPASDAAGNRWRDLSLSFDAEPVLPRTRRDRDAAAEHPGTTPPPVSERAEPAGEPARQHEADADADAPAAVSGDDAEDAAADQAPGHRAGNDQEPENREPENREPENQEAEDGPGAPAAPEPPAAVQTGGPAGSDPTEPDIVTYGAAEEPRLPTPGSDALIHGPPRPEPAADGTESADADTASDYGFRSRADEEVLVLDLDAPQAPGAEGSGTAETEPSGSGDAFPTDDAETREPDTGEEPDSPPRDEAALDVAPPDDAPAGGPQAMESDALDALEESHAPATPPGIDTPAADETHEAIPVEETDEDQLHLELEATGDTEADIPVLTNAVYVPGAPPETPRPVDLPHAARIGHCIDDLRARLRLMELDALSAEQEQALHDTLAEMLAELDRE